MEKILYFGVFDFVEVFVHNTLVYIVQKYLVDSNRHPLIINSWMYNRAFVVYFYFVGKWVIFTLIL